MKRVFWQCGAFHSLGSLETPEFTSLLLLPAHITHNWRPRGPRVSAYPLSPHLHCRGTESTGDTLASLPSPPPHFSAIDDIHHSPTFSSSPHLIYTLFQDNCLPARNIDEPDEQAVQNSRSVQPPTPCRLRLQRQLTAHREARWQPRESEKGLHPDDRLPAGPTFWLASSPIMRRSATRLPPLLHQVPTSQSGTSPVRTQQRYHHGEEEKRNKQGCSALSLSPRGSSA